MASTAVSMLAYAVMTMHLDFILFSFIYFMSSRPFMPSIMRSVITISYSSAFIALTASAPFDAQSAM